MADSIRRAVLGKDRLVRLTLTSLPAGGHLLPGVAALSTDSTAVMTA